ncbi:MAG: GNAT family N-acetyltransferase, partial [Acidimicrobiales bacterium]
AGSGGVAVRPGTEADARFAAELHARSINEGFLPTLGPAFLARLYRRIVRHAGSFLLVAVAHGDGRPVGFVAGTEDVGSLYREFARRDGVRAGLVAAPRLARSWRHAWETLRYPSVGGELPGGGDLPPAELLAMAVEPAARGRGVGRQLVDAFLSELGRRDVGGARVVAATANRAAIGLYQSAGFRPATRLELHRGTTSEVLVWP